MSSFNNCNVYVDGLCTTVVPHLETPEPRMVWYPGMQNINTEFNHCSIHFNANGQRMNNTTTTFNDCIFYVNKGNLPGLAANTATVSTQTRSRMRVHQGTQTEETSTNALNVAVPEQILSSTLYELVQWAEGQQGRIVCKHCMKEYSCKKTLLNHLYKAFARQYITQFHAGGKGGKRRYVLLKEDVMAPQSMALVDTREEAAAEEVHQGVDIEDKNLAKYIKQEE